MKPHPHWEVAVFLDGDNILTIGHNHLSGTPDIDEHADIVRHAAAQLRAFIGDSPSEAQAIAQARAEGREEAARLVEQEKVDTSIRLDPFRHKNVSDWFREQQAAAIRNLQGGGDG